MGCIVRWALLACALATGVRSQSCVIGGTIDRYGVLLTAGATKKLTVKVSGTEFLPSIATAAGLGDVHSMVTGNSGEWDAFEPTAVASEDRVALSSDNTMLTITVTAVHSGTRWSGDSLTVVIPAGRLESGSALTCTDTWSIAALPPWVASLEALYDAANGAGWTRRTGWKTDYAAPCFWDGVDCDADGVLTGVFLMDNGLSTGSLAAATSDLAGMAGTLKQLHLSRNPSLTFALADLELERFSALEVFAAHSCDLTGSLPTAWAVGTLPALQEIHLYRNSLSGAIPAEWAGLPSLNTVLLQHNQLTGTLPQWANPREALVAPQSKKPARFWAYQNLLTEAFPQHDTLALQEARYPFHASKRSNDPYNDEPTIP